MNKKLISLCLLLPLALGLVSCSSMVKTNQLQFGIQAAQKDLWDEAIFRWEKSAELNPASAAVYNNLAVAYEKKGRWEEAEKAYTMAIKLSPDNKYIKSNYKKYQERLETNEKEKLDKDKNEKK